LLCLDVYIHIYIYIYIYIYPLPKKFGKPCPGMLHCVPGQEVTIVVKDISVFIFEIECAANLPNIANHLLSVVV